MDFIQELDDLKNFIISLTDPTVELTSMPPQHVFSKTATIESVIDKIDKIKSSWVSNRSANSINSSAYTLRYFVDHSDFDSNDRFHLLEIANMIDNEISDIKESQSQKFKFSTDVSTNCLALAQYINSYIENNGPRTEKFINGLYQYLDAINKEIKDLKERPNDTLMLKIKDIFDHS